MIKFHNGDPIVRCCVVKCFENASSSHESEIDYGIKWPNGEDMPLVRTITWTCAQHAELVR